MSDTCGNCKFFVRWENKDAFTRGTMCGWKPPRVAGIEGWGKTTPRCTEGMEACSMFVNVQQVAQGPRRVRLGDDE